MLKLVVPLGESFNEETSEFVVTESFTLHLEHSLASLSKWEAKFEKAFLSKEEKTPEEVIYYYQHCMLVDDDVPLGIFEKLTEKNYVDLQAYINGKHTATWFTDPKNASLKGRNQVITAAVITGWMIALKIPFETRHWHLNELFTQIRVVNDQSQPPKKMSRADAARQQSELNARRKAQMGTRG